jgi:TonB family protein
MNARAIRGAAAAVAVGVWLAPLSAGAQDGGAAPDEQIDASKLSKVPKQIKFVEADYPPDAFAKGIEAEVILILDIDETGAVTSVGIDTPASPPDLGFDEAAMLAAQSWQFEPAEMDGKPIAVQITYRYRFTLKPKSPPAPATQPGEPASQPSAPPGKDAAPEPAKVPVVNFTGKLVERGTRTPMAGVVVTVFRDDVEPPIGFEATTDASGRFDFFDLAAAQWKVLVDAPGYYPYRTSESITTNERVDVTYYVEKGSYNPYDVTITAERPRKEVNRTVITAAEIEKVPGGAGDPLAVIENFAGVARSPNPGEIVVRGSAPEDTRILVDGIEVPLIYHFGGLRSVLPTGVLSSIDFYPGNFSPSYGRATGGIIDVRIKELRPERVRGYADVSILDTGVYLEIPLGRDGGLALAGRRSYIDAILSAALPADAGISFNTAPRYYDYQLLGNYRPAPAHSLRLFVFGSDDRLEAIFANPGDLDPSVGGNDLNSSTTFFRVAADYRFVPSTRFENSLRVSVGRDAIDFNIGTLLFDLTQTAVQVRDNARWQISDRFTLTAGVDVIVEVADFLVRLPRPPKEGQPQTDFDIDEVITTEVEGQQLWDPAFYLEGEITLSEGLLVLPGLRVDRIDITDQTIVQPRFTARWQVPGTKVTAKGGVGLFVQEPQPEETDVKFGNPDLGVERAIHYSVGAEVQPVEWLALDVTGFYKTLDDLVSPTDATVMDGGMMRPLVYDNGGEGRVIGLEVSARQKLAYGLTGWLAYTLSRAERTDSGAGESRLFDYDQTHIFTVVANYLLPRNWQIGGRFRLVSGSPTTPVVGSVYNASQDEYDPVYGPTNSTRNGTFHQLDIRVDKRWIYKSWILSAYLDIQNIYNRQNPEGRSYNFDYSESKTQTGVPLFTIIGLRAEI